MPAALFNDDFNRADESPLSGGGKWAGGYSSSSQNDLAIVGNEIRMAGGVGGNDAVEGWTTAPENNQWAKTKIITLSDATYAQAGVLGRLTAPTAWTSYMGVGGTTPNADINEVTSGSVANLATSAISWAANDNLVCAVRESTINLYKNGGVPVVTATDATITSGRIGETLFAFTALGNSEADDFMGGTLPITLVAAGTEADAASGNVTPGTPAGIIAGDILVVICHSTDQVSHSMGTGWTQVVQGNGGGTTSHLSVWWHRYNGIAVPSALITHTAGGGTIAGMAAFRGCVRGGDPFDVVGTINGGTDASMEHNGITIATDGALILAINGSADDNNRNLLSGWTNVFEDTIASTQNAFVGTLGAGALDESCSMFYVDGFIGSTGTVTVTQAAADAWASVLVALKPDIQGFRVDPTLQAVKRAGFF